MPTKAAKPHGRPLPDGKRKYGWVPDVPDGRDAYLAVPRMKLPPFVNLQPLFPDPPYDQGALGSCTAQAAAAVIQFDQHKQGIPVTMPSRLFIYYTERVMEGTVDVDSGATIRDSVKAINKGYATEDLWPYDVDRFDAKPPKTAYADAKGHKCVKYQRVPRTVYSMKACLARGLPFLLGFSVYESFESAEVERTGKAAVPSKDEAMLGGHAVVCCGYTEDGYWVCRNSWSADWGDQGYFYLPQTYLITPDLSDDFWCVTLVK